MSMRQFKISKTITTRESESLKKYLAEIKKLELISPEEETRLAEQIKKGDKKALDHLVTANLRFVVSVAKQYQNRGLSLPDLVNEGNLGLIKAAGNFDPSRGFKFISYAIWWIRQYIVQAIAAHAGMVRIPYNKLALKDRIRKTGSLLEQELERAASEEELAAALNIDAEEIAFGLTLNDQCLSLDMPLSEDAEDSMLDVLENPDASPADKEVNFRQSLQTEIERSFQVLNKQQKDTLCFLFGIGVDQPLSMDAIGEKFNVSNERVRQIKDKALNKLRTSANFNLLRSFLGI
jgi:RNA polymerase primary sigma factor